MNYRDYQDELRHIVDMHSSGIISKEQFMSMLAGIRPDDPRELETIPGEREAVEVDGFQENATDAFPSEHTYPIGSLIRPYQKMSMYTANVQLNDAPGFRRTPNIHIPNRAVQVQPMMYWTVVEHRSGWSKIASADGRHSGWHFYVRDYFQLIDDKTIEEYERDKRR